jgi:hypothetical protein
MPQRNLFPAPLSDSQLDNSHLGHQHKIELMHPAARYATWEIWGQDRCSAKLLDQSPLCLRGISGLAGPGLRTLFLLHEQPGTSPRGKRRGH